MSTKKPNIIVIYPDQMRYDSMSPSGNKVVRTPHLQRLADEGAMFDNAFTSYPLCCPFRASIMTGKQAQGHGMYQNHFPLNANQEFLAERMVGQGYRTLYAGKWHLEGGPKPGYVPLDRRFGFEKWAGFNRGHSYMDGLFWRETDQPFRCKRYEPDFQTDHLLEFIDEARAETPDAPFFGFVSFGPPHHPNDMPEYWRKMYRPDEIDLSEAHLPPEEWLRIQRQRVKIDCNGDENAALKSRVAYGDKKQLEPETEDEVRTFIAEYYGMISCIDYNVGRIMNKLDRLGIADDTMVIFLSDHGDMLGEHGYPCGYKPQGYRAAMQVPFIVRYPRRIEGGRRIDGLIDVGIDTPVTLLDLVDATPFSEAHGISYLPLLDGSARETRDSVMYQTFRMDAGAKGEYTPVPERGIRTKDWLYVRQPERRKFLFNQENDARELNNLAEDEAYVTLMDGFDKRISDHMNATGDDWDLHLEFPPPDFLTHGDAARHLKEELLPRAILVP